MPRTTSVPVDGSAEWVWIWKQPSWQRRFLTFVFWEGILCTPLAVIYAYGTSGRWKLAAAAVPVAGLLVAFAQRYGKADRAKADAGPSPATTPVRAAGADEKPAESSAGTPESQWAVRFVTPEDSADRADYANACRALGLAESAGGWGLLCCADEDGQRFTMLTADLTSIRAHQTARGIDVTTFSVSGWGVQAWRQGWPQDWLDDAGGDEHA